MIVGKLSEIWLYPVKSMRGAKLESCRVGASGLHGDRGWALRDEAAGEIRGAKYMPKLLQCSASYRQTPTEETIPHVDITLPDGTRVGSDEPEINSRLSDLVGRTVSLRRREPAANRSYYRRAQVGASVMSKLSRLSPLRPHLGTLIRLAGLDAHTRAMFSREPDEPLPDFSKMPSELFEFTSPPGTYFDAFPIHLLTTSSLAAMARINPAARWDVRRFRPNFLIKMEDELEGLIESRWSGQTLRVGELKFSCEMPTVRCGMPTQAQAELPKDTTVLRSIVKDAGQNLGIYANALNSGSVSTGDVVELL